MPIDAFFLLLVLATASLGFAMLVRALPGIHRLQAWLEGTWTAGKPLSCWVCLSGWSGLLLLGIGVLLQPPWLPDATLLALLWLGSTGLAGLVLRLTLPILPASGAAPIIEFEPDTGEGKEHDRR